MILGNGVTFDHASHKFKYRDILYTTDEFHWYWRFRLLDEVGEGEILNEEILKCFPQHREGMISQLATAENTVGNTWWLVSGLDALAKGEPPLHTLPPQLWPVPPAWTKTSTATQLAPGSVSPTNRDDTTSREAEDSERHVKKLYRRLCALRLHLYLVHVKKYRAAPYGITEQLFMADPEDEETYKELFGRLHVAYGRPRMAGLLNAINELFDRLTED